MAFQNNERKFYLQLERDDTKTYQQPGVRETERCWTKKQTKKHNEKAEWINNMTKELEGLKEGPKEEIHKDSLKTTLKHIKLENARPWWNTCFLVQ